MQNSTDDLVNRLADPKGQIRQAARQELVASPQRDKLLPQIIAQLYDPKSVNPGLAQIASYLSEDEDEYGDATTTVGQAMYQALTAAFEPDEIAPQVIASLKRTREHGKLALALLIKCHSLPYCADVVLEYMLRLPQYEHLPALTLLRRHETLPVLKPYEAKLKAHYHKAMYMHPVYATLLRQFVNQHGPDIILFDQAVLDKLVSAIEKYPYMRLPEGISLLYHYGDARCVNALIRHYRAIRFPSGMKTLFEWRKAESGYTKRVLEVIRTHGNVLHVAQAERPPFLFIFRDILAGGCAGCIMAPIILVYFVAGLIMAPIRLIARLVRR